MGVREDRKVITKALLFVAFYVYLLTHYTILFGVDLLFYVVMKGGPSTEVAN